MAIQKVAHAEIRVEDLSNAIEFHTDVLGLSEVGRDNGTVYLGCGVDEDYDLALTEGGTGLAHVALQVESEEDLDHYEQRLSDAGVTGERRTDGEPGQTNGLRFTTPTGHSFELVTTAGCGQYLTPAAPKLPRLRGISPIDIDHVTLRVDDVKGFCEFLGETLDVRVSDVFSPAPEVWVAAWTRVGEYHHDIAMLGGQPGETLDHIAWTMNGSDHLKQGADQLAQTGIGLEAGPGRHGIGGNLFAYFWAPGGNRYELSAEMPRTFTGHETGVWSDFPKAFSVWGQAPPESFQKGS